MYVPPGQSPPFEVVDELHHGAWLIITAALGLVVSIVCFLIRLYVRLMLIPPFARDDWVLLGATVSDWKHLIRERSLISDRQWQSCKQV